MEKVYELSANPAMRVMAFCTNGVCRASVTWSGPGEWIKMQIEDAYQGKTEEELMALGFRYSHMDPGEDF